MSNLRTPQRQFFWIHKVIINVYILISHFIGISRRLLTLSCHSTDHKPFKIVVCLIFMFINLYKFKVPHDCVH